MYFFSCKTENSESLNYVEYDIEQLKISCPENWIKKEAENTLLCFKIDSLQKNRYFILLKIPKGNGINSIKDYVCNAHIELMNPHEYVYKGISYDEIVLKDSSISYAGHILTEFEEVEFVSMDTYFEDKTNIYKITLNVKKVELEEYSVIFSKILSSVEYNEKLILMDDFIAKKHVKIDSLCNSYLSNKITLKLGSVQICT